MSKVVELFILIFFMFIPIGLAQVNQCTQWCDELTCDDPVCVEIDAQEPKEDDVKVTVELEETKAEEPDLSDKGVAILVELTPEEFGCFNQKEDKKDCRIAGMAKDNRKVLISN